MKLTPKRNFIPVLFPAVLVLLTSVLDTLPLKDKLTKRPYPFYSAAEYDAPNAVFYGRIKIGKDDYFAAIRSRTGEKTVLAKLPFFKNWARRVSALDSSGQKFFFAAYPVDKQHLCTVDTRTGRVLQTVALSHPVKAIEFDASSGKLWGLSFFSGVERFVSIAPSTGTVSTISNVSPFKCTNSGVLANADTHRFLFIGTRGHDTHVCVIDTRNGKVRPLPGIYVNVNEYRVVDFKADRTVETVFTCSVQSCTGIAGYDPASEIGFIAHFVPTYGEIGHSLTQIDKEIGKVNNRRGLRNMKLTVVGGVRDHPDSVKNLMLVYTLLTEKYGIDYEEIVSFNTGISYNIVIHNGEVNVL